MPSAQARYVGRFAPSPTGPLHAGSLVAALASWLDARARHGGRWLVRIEDLDTARCVAAAAPLILQQLQACGLLSDEAPVFQSARTDLYHGAFERLLADALVYPCACSRRDIEIELERLGQPRARHGELVYPGTCRAGLRAKPAVAWRLRTDAATRQRQLLAAPGPAATALAQADAVVRWLDRRLGPQQQNVSAQVGDFVVLRADGQFAYQLAVVVDDAAQNVTHVVRGEDLADNTARQLLLQAGLGLATPHYLHTALVLSPGGEKLSKQTGAGALDTSEPLAALNAAAGVLGLSAQSGAIGDALAAWVAAWRRLYNPAL